MRRPAQRPAPPGAKTSSLALLNCKLATIGAPAPSTDEMDSLEGWKVGLREYANDRLVYALWNDTANTIYLSSDGKKYRLRADGAKTIFSPYDEETYSDILFEKDVKDATILETHVLLHNVVKHVKDNRNLEMVTALMQRIQDSTPPHR